MTKTKPTSWRDVLVAMIQAKSLTPYGRFNIIMTILLMVIVLLTILPNIVETIVNAVLTYLGKETQSMPVWVTIGAIVILLLEFIFCWYVVMKPAFVKSKTK